MNDPAMRWKVLLTRTCESSVLDVEDGELRIELVNGLLDDRHQRRTVDGGAHEKHNVGIVVLQNGNEDERLGRLVEAAVTRGFRDPDNRAPPAPDLNPLADWVLAPPVVISKGAVDDRDRP